MCKHTRTKHGGGACANRHGLNVAIINSCDPHAWHMHLVGQQVTPHACHMHLVGHYRAAYPTRSPVSGRIIFNSSTCSSLSDNVMQLHCQLVSGTHMRPTAMQRIYTIHEHSTASTALRAQHYEHSTASTALRAQHYEHCINLCARLMFFNN